VQLPQPLLLLLVLVFAAVLAELLPVVGLPLDSIPVVIAVVLAVLVSMALPCACLCSVYSAYMLRELSSVGI
jgi:hypothetical protein